jgi:hypothetical protein
MNYLTSKLDKSRTYTFSIPFTGFNSLICTPPQRPEFFYCGSFSKDGKDFISAYDEKDPFVSSLPKQDLLVFKDTEELITFVKNLPKIDGQGVIGVQKINTTPIVVKVYNGEYKKEYDKRMKQNELLYEYLTIRTEELRRQNFLRDYSELNSIVEEYDSIIESISVKIFDIYQAKFVKKMEMPMVHSLIWKILRDLHKWHLKGFQEKEEKEVPCPSGQGTFSEGKRGGMLCIPTRASGDVAPCPCGCARESSRSFSSFRRRMSANIVTQDVVYDKVDTLAANDMRRLILDYMKCNPQIRYHVL